MDVDSKQELSFSALDQRLRDVPDGPSSILNTPRVLKVMNLVALIGALLGVIPYFLIQWLEPTSWMVSMARFGLVVLVVAGLPDLIRNCGVLGLQFWRWRSEQVRQLDHDRAFFEYILDWLAGFSSSQLMQNERVARLSLGQLTAKIGFLAGGLDKLGVLPVFVSVFLFVRQWGDPLAMPLWQVGVGVGLILFYAIVTTANLMRIRLQMYEALFNEALKRKAAAS